MTRKCPGCKKPFKKDEPYPDVENCEVCERFGPPKIDEGSDMNNPRIDPSSHGFQLQPDQLQNELLVLSHHLDDIEEAVKGGDRRGALTGLKDCHEIAERLSGFLPQNQASEIERMAEDIHDEDDISCFQN